MKDWNNLKFLQKSEAGEKEINLILLHILLTQPSIFLCPSCIPRKNIFLLLLHKLFFSEKEPITYIFRIISIYAHILQGNTFTVRLVAHCSRQPREILSSTEVEMLEENVEMFEAQTLPGSLLQLTHL